MDQAGKSGSRPKQSCLGFLSSSNRERRLRFQVRRLPSLPVPQQVFREPTSRPGRGLCAVDSGGVERCTGAADNGNSAVPTPIVPDSSAIPWLTVVHVDANATAFPEAKNKAAFFGVILPFRKTTRNVTYSVGTPDASSATYDMGIYSGISGGKCTLVAHTGPTPGKVSMTRGFHTVNWAEGKITLSPGRYYLAITASGTKSLARLGGDSAQLTFAGIESQERPAMPH